MNTRYFIIQYTLYQPEDIQPIIDTLDEYHMQFQIQFLNGKTIIQSTYQLDYTDPEELYQIYHALNSLCSLDPTISYKSSDTPFNLFEYEQKTI